MTTLFELKQNMGTFGQQIAKIEKDLTAKAIDPQSTREDIQALQSQKADMQTRFDVIKAQHDALEKKQAERLANDPLANIENPQQKYATAKAGLIRATLRQQPVPAEIKAILGDNTTPSTGGEKFLPKTLSTELIVEPLAKNPLREIVNVTNITNLELPKLSFTLSDDDFVKDSVTAKELEATGSTVAFTRKKFKVFAGISETVLNGSDVNLVTHVDNALRSGLAAKEKKVQLATTPATGEEHMSFYSTQNAIVEVTGSTTFNAIKKALAALHEDYRENASIVMSYADYLDMIETLSNGVNSFFGIQPETIFGKKIIFADGATKPIVGDFSYSHINYDLDLLYDRDKDVKTGVELFVITAWIDHRIKLASAFRIAEVVPTP